MFACAAGAVAAATLLVRPDRSASRLRARYGAPGSRFLRLRDGVVVHVRDEGPRQAPVVVLCHGMLGDVAMWDHWARALRTRYRVLRFDWPGHGLTWVPPAYLHTVQRDRELLGELLDALGIRSAVIGGQSLGADVAWRYALAEPDRVAALVLVDASGWADGRPGYRAAAAALRVLKSERLRRILGVVEPGPSVYVASRMTFFPSRIPKGIVKRYRDLLLHPSHRRAFHELLAGWDDRPVATVDALRRIRVPVLVLHGARDLAVPMAHAVAFTRAIRGAELRVLRQAGHVPVMTHPRETVAIMEDWLDRIDAIRPGPAA
jgi:pimeloyl-ACP methyl ester carboxylesterase